MSADDIYLSSQAANQMLSELGITPLEFGYSVK